MIISKCTRYDDPFGAPVTLRIEEGRVHTVEPAAVADEGDITAEGLIVAPGLFDVHIHGAGGADAGEGSRESLDTMSRALAEQGTTSFLATVFAPPSDEHPHLRTAARAGFLPGASILGIHVEGPYLNPVRKGGIPLSTIRPPTGEDLAAITEACGDSLRMMTIAPEMPGATEVIDRLSDAGVVMAFGHSDATYAQTIDGFGAGIRHVTHLYNAMRPFHHREPGPIPAILEREDVSLQLIADGTHIGNEMIRWTIRQVGMDRCVLVSDGMAGTGLPEGAYRFQGRDYTSEGGVARYADGTLIGTTCGLIGIVRHVIETTGCRLDEAIDAASRAPARVLGLDHAKGGLDQGKDADLILLDHDLDVVTTIVGGRVVFDRRHQTPAMRRL